MPGKLSMNGVFGSITPLFVRKQYRGRALHCQLLREIAQFAKSEGLEYLVGRPNAEADAIYRLLGSNKSLPN
jgi:acetyltransferase (GNAT) family protein